ncbi:hypothetical protein APB26_31905 [Pseudomonas aeruginosa]|nr:hypothetical protein APB26_31905 [Pseudomonas aeruginosa]RPV61263.1 hypothetical protein IPC838_18235 [Pseudomonas aeruginosa]
MHLTRTVIAAMWRIKRNLINQSYVCDRHLKAKLLTPDADVQFKGLFWCPSAVDIAITYPIQLQGLALEITRHSGQASEGLRCFGGEICHRGVLQL